MSGAFRTWRYNKAMEIQQRAREVLTAMIASLEAIEITSEFAEAVGCLRNCKGKVLTTGMGKAGHVARKFAATLCSTGTPAAYIHPGEAAHGDLGLIAEEDVIVAFSTSGKTREVIEMLELGRHLGLAKVIGITSHPDSALRYLAEVILDMGEIEEPGPLGLTLSSSILVMMALADTLALVLMEANDIDRNQYGLRHHGGYLGRQARLDND